MSEVHMMNEPRTIRVEVDHEQKERVESKLKDFGFSLRFAVQTFLHRIDRTGRLPFDLPQPDSDMETSSDAEPEDASGT